MKIAPLAILAALMLAPAVRADAPTPESDGMSVKDKIFALIRLNDSTQAELNAAQAKLVKALEDNQRATNEKIKEDAVARAEIQRQTKAKDQAEAETKEAKNQFGYRAWAFIKFWAKVIGGVTAGLYLLALIGGFCGPATFMFKLAQQLISFLPFAQIVEFFHSTVVVKARTVPVVPPPVVVTRNADAAERISEMTT